MTNEQIRERCEQWVGEQDKDWSGVLANLESLYREAMANGLEMAADIVWGVTMSRWMEPKFLSDLDENHKMRDGEERATASLR